MFVASLMVADRLVPVQASTKNATSLIPDAPDLSALRAQKAWDLALAPAKNVPMQG